MVSQKAKDTGEDDRLHVHKTLLVESAVFAESAINRSTETGAKDCGIHRASEVALVEKGCDLVTLLETSHARSDFFDNSGSIGSWNHTLLDGEGVFALAGSDARTRGHVSRGVQTYLGNGKVAEIQRCSMDCDISKALATVQPNIHLTRTSLSPRDGTGAFSSHLRDSKPSLPCTVHCLDVEGAMVSSGEANQKRGYRDRVWYQRLYVYWTRDGVQRYISSAKAAAELFVYRCGVFLVTQ